MTATRTVTTATASERFITYLPETGHSAHSGDRKMNAPSTKPTSQTFPAGPDCSDHAQAQVFAAMLTAEIETVSALVDDAEQLARKAGRVGQGSARLWHKEEGRSQRKLLYELHRQLGALRTRFPDVCG
ncbi:hypothetical protein HQO90_17650 [Rhodococcus fascians]|nr:hypothetical protein [Rhodococcus fascians]MBY4059107.1 hypothetical protein [Rhodococcus fascians]MBY4070380.1 hypothetical protein [Rhodococcus fascians]